MKKTFFISLIIVMIITSGCVKRENNNLNSTSNNPTSDLVDDSEEKNMNSAPSFDSSVADNINNIIKTANNNTDYKEMIKNKISLNNFCQDYLYYNYNPNRSYVPTIAQIGEKYPVECLRNSPTNCYAIYETDNDALIYAFFLHQSLLASCIYMKNKLASSDFISINIGSAFSDVEKIDSVATIWGKQQFISKIDSFQSYHLLTDGILVLTYTLQTDGAYTVSDKFFSKDFMYSSGESKVTYNFNILSQDYIK